MSTTRRRINLLLTLVAAFALCTGLQRGPLVSAKDKTEKGGVGEAGSASDDAAGSESKTKVKASAAKKKARPETKKKRGQREADESVEGSTPSGNGSSSLSPTLPGAAGAGSNAGSNTGSAAGTTTGAGPNAPAVGRAGTQKVNKVGNGKTGGAAGNAAPGVQPGPNPDVVKKVIDVQNRNTPKLLAQKGIVGTATGVDDDGNVVIRVYTTGADEPVIPKTLENVPVVEVLTGHWLKYWQTPPVFDPTLRQPRPVPIGVSAVNVRDVCGNVIATGTLGCRLRDKDGAVFALSNNHVFADENAGVIGDKIIQPGSLDEFNDNLPICAPADVIGTLFKFKELIPGGTPNIIDAAIVKTTTSLVGNATPPSPVAYGTPRTTVNNRPFIGLRVQKLGRTTGFTTGTITGLNQIVQVQYTPGLVTFVSQIEITGDVGLFADHGDSGSLIVDMDRFPVALLFAGAGPLISGNPIQAVLDEFGMTIDGDDSRVFPPGKEARSTPNSP
jgi:hypothetical protein